MPRPDATPPRPPQREMPHLAACLATGEPVCRLGLAVEDCEALRERLLWLLGVRDFVVLGAAFGVVAGFLLFPAAANWLALAVIVAATAAANALWLVRRGRLSGCRGAVDFASQQVLTDFVLLAAAVHFTGGVGGPLAPLFVLHGVLSAALLPPRVALRNLAVALGLLGVSAALGGLFGLDARWAFAAPGFAPSWVPVAIRAGFLMLMLAGASGLGLTLAEQLRRRHHRVELLARELLDRNRELEAVDEHRLRLLAVATHDLKSPLAAVEARLDLLFAGHAGPLSDTHREHLQRMKVRLAGLRAFITDLLDLTALESQGGASRFVVEVDVMAQVRDVVRELTPAVEAAGLHVHLDLLAVPVIVRADPERLAQVWTNLLSNAVKYGAGGNDISIVGRADDASVSVSVADRGIGIGEADRPQLFREFFRAASARQAGIPGTGLGLAIVKRIVDGLGGTVGVTSELERGSTFTVTLPRAGDGPEMSDVGL